MTRLHFDDQLDLLNRQLIEMGALVENAIMRAVDALLKKDATAAKQAIRFDSRVDAKEKEIEAL